MLAASQKNTRDNQHTHACTLPLNTTHTLRDIWRRIHLLVIMCVVCGARVFAICCHSRRALMTVRWWWWYDAFGDRLTNTLVLISVVSTNCFYSRRNKRYKMWNGRDIIIWFTVERRTREQKPTIPFCLLFAIVVTKKPPPPTNRQMNHHPRTTHHHFNEQHHPQITTTEPHGFLQRWRLVRSVCKLPKCPSQLKIF